MTRPLYFDYMATTPLDPRVAQKMSLYLDHQHYFGNAESTHLYGLPAQAASTEARHQVASLINGDPAGVIWTSGATESNNLALKGATGFYKRQGTHLITSRLEHKSVLEVFSYLETQGFTVTYLTPQSDGILALEDLVQACRPDTILVSLMHVNNEIGVIQNLLEIGKLTSSRGILFHVDAAQSAGKLPIDVQAAKIDLLSLSAHKIYGPKGIGALYLRQNPRLHLVPQLHGGGQEQGLRSGTLATHQIVGLGEACALAQQELAPEYQRLLRLRELLWQELAPIPGLTLNGALEQRIANNLNISIAGLPGERLLAALPEVALSTTAACNRLQPSHVLMALGVAQQRSLESLRISFGRFTTEAEILALARQLKNAITKLRPLPDDQAS